MESDAEIPTLLSLSLGNCQEKHLDSLSWSLKQRAPEGCQHDETRLMAVYDVKVRRRKFLASQAAFFG